MLTLCRVLHLADISAPRMGSSAREDEVRQQFYTAMHISNCSFQPWAYEAREYLRTRVVGKPVTFTVAHSLSSNDDTPRDIGSVDMQGVDITTQLLKAGWAKLKEMKREPTEADLKKRDLEAEAKAAGKGIWNPHGPMARKVAYMMPEDSQGFITEWKGKSIDGVVEQVKDGSTLRIRLLLPDGDHQFVNVTLAGVRSPRVASKPDETSELYGEEVSRSQDYCHQALTRSFQAKFFTETRLLQRQVSVQLLSLPNATATPFQSAANAAPAPASIFIGSGMSPHLYLFCSPK